MPGGARISPWRSGTILREERNFVEVVSGTFEAGRSSPRQRHECEDFQKPAAGFRHLILST